MRTFADISIQGDSIILWLIVGLVAGWLAGVVMKGGGYGILGDIIIGLVGAVLGGYLFGLLNTGPVSLLGAIVVAFIGACILIAIVRFLAPGRTQV